MACESHHRVQKGFIYGKAIYVKILGLTVPDLKMTVKMNSWIRWFHYMCTYPSIFRMFILQCRKTLYNSSSGSAFLFNSRVAERR